MVRRLAPPFIPVAAVLQELARREFGDHALVVFYGVCILLTVAVVVALWHFRPAK